LHFEGCVALASSLDWSPAVEMQAIARAHRIGVAHPVAVHRLIARGSIDDHVVRIQGQKLAYASETVRGYARQYQVLGFDPTNLYSLAKIFALIM
jgi:SNF2 family DNA or RNA helicase